MTGMSDGHYGPAGLRVLVLAPTGRDAALTLDVLAGAGIAAASYRSAARLAEEIGLGAGVVLVAEEALETEDASDFFAALDAQPSWSALPVLVMSSQEGDAERLLATVAARANITILQRPARVAVLLSAVRAALRSRSRQYETRDLLERLRESDRQKDEFLATISHELRTPLNSMVGWTALMRAEACSVAVHARGLDVIERNAAAQKRIVEDLLEMSRMIAGKLQLEARRIDLVDAVAAAVESVRPAATARGVALEASLPSLAVWVHGDPDRLQQIAWNLLSNAVKFTPPGGRVTVEAGADSGSAFLRVSDTGPGIAPAFLPHVFERFRQADGSTTRSFGGLGLGLAIARHLAELHGGSVRAESAGQGRGATFVVTLPSAADGSSNGALRTSGTQPDVALLARVPSLDGVRVLVVDDNVDAVEMMKALMGGFGAEVRGAVTAEDGLAEVTAWRPDVLVSDVAMPGQDGYWLIEQVRLLAPEDGGRTPAVALTALADHDDRTRALLAGFQQHLRKPVSLGELAATVAALAGRRAPAELA
jgi:signal transduction histidine kinase/ActR/RegA family two-component response regulator